MGKTKLASVSRKAQPAAAIATGAAVIICFAQFNNITGQ